MLTKTGAIACDYCGKFIAIDELIEQTATHSLLTPDSEFTKEEYESYHNPCLAKSKRKKPHWRDCLASEIPGGSCQFPKCDC